MGVPNSEVLPRRYRLSWFAFGRKGMGLELPRKNQLKA